MTSETLALLGMAGGATAAVFTAAGFIIGTAIKFGRHLERFDGIGDDLKELKDTVKVHLDWHRDEAQEAQAE